MNFVFFVFSVIIFCLVLLGLYRRLSESSSIIVLLMILLYGSGISAITYYFATQSLFATWIYVVVGALLSLGPEHTVMGVRSANMTPHGKRELGFISLFAFAISMSLFLWS